MQSVVIPYKPRPLQKKLHKQLKRFNVLVMHRRFGKTVFAINELVKQIMLCKLERPRGAYICPLYSQAKRVAWDYLKHYTAVIPGVKYNEAELRADFPNGGRISLLGADNVDSLRGIYLDEVVLDEYAQMKPSLWTTVIRPALSDRKGRAIFIGTPQGLNGFYDLYDKAGDMPDWFRMLYRASETGVVDPAELLAMHEEMEENEYLQELECSWSAAIRGAYYAKRLEETAEQVMSVPYDESIPVITSCDLGIADSFSIWYFQEAAGEIRVIDYDEYTGMGLPDIIREMDKKPYIYGRHIAPHDIRVRELGSGNSRLEIAAKLGIKYEIAPMIGVQDGINAVRSAIPRMYFDSVKCKEGLEALKQYHSQYNEKTRVFSNAPVHDWCSHAADAMRYYCITKHKSSKQAQPLNYPKRNRKY